MKQLSPRRRFLLDLSRYLYAVALFSRSRSFLGLRLSSWLHLLPLALAAVALVRGWGGTAVFGSLLLFGLVVVFNGYARRRGYKEFIPDPDEPVPVEGTLLPPNKRIKLRATGTFAVTSRESYVLDQAPSTYWRVPLGEHVIMVEQMKGRFLYQFFRAETLDTIEPGHLIVGARTRKALAITFWVTWGPGFHDETIAYYVGGNEKPPERFKRTIYFTFDKDETRLAVWHTIWHDMVAGDEKVQDNGSVDK